MHALATLKEEWLKSVNGIGGDEFCKNTVPIVPQFLKGLFKRENGGISGEIKMKTG